jgi:hypothetical protein
LDSGRRCDGAENPASLQPLLKLQTSAAAKPEFWEAKGRAKENPFVFSDPGLVFKNRLKMPRAAENPPYAFLKTNFFCSEEFGFVLTERILCRVAKIQNEVNPILNARPVRAFKETVFGRASPGDCGIPRGIT